MNVKRLENYLGVFLGPQRFKDAAEAFSAMNGLLSNVTIPYGNFCADNLITFNRNLSFLEDDKFMQAIDEHTETDIEKATIWRIYLLCWAAKRGMQLEGDFVECGCYRGISANIICDYVGLGDSEKNYFLYDLFEHTDDMGHHAMPGHSRELYEWVRNRFAHLKRVHVIKGYLPDSLRRACPTKIALLHVDVSNNYPAAIGIVESLYDRVSPGGTIVLEGYGWLDYAGLKRVYDPFFAERGQMVLELPTGQGLVIK